MLDQLYTPIITATATVMTVIIKDIVQVNFLNKNARNRKIQEEQLVSIYNKILIIYLKYDNKLEIEYETEVEVDGDVYSFFSIDIKNKDIWDDLIEEMRELVHDNIHLLTYEDLQCWNKFDKKWNSAFESEEELADQYQSFKVFLKRAVGTYGALYYEYHGISKKEEKRITKIDEKGQ